VPTSSAPPATPVNSAGLELEPVVTPVSPATVRVDSPQPGDHVALAAARDYTVHWSSEHLDTDALGVDIALDSHRPRRVAANESVVALGTLVPADEELLAGEHWLFAAPVTASGLVPSRAASGPRSAVAVRFFVGESSSNAAPSGAVWLRGPEGTYNGPNAEHVLFDAHVFGADGKASTPSLTLTLALRGKTPSKLTFSAPFSVRALASGDYDVSASAPGLTPSARVFTVNAELGGKK